MNTLDSLKEWTAWVVRWLVIVWMFSLGLAALPFGRDDSDGAWPNRSGLKPKTDALTGCQYLQSPGGGITPRLDANGRHIGCAG